MWVSIALALHLAAALPAAPAFTVEVTGSGPAMILVPGLLSSGDVWQQVVEHYRPRYPCHVLTLAGFAGVPPVDPRAWRGFERICSSTSAASGFSGDPRDDRNY